MALSAGIVLEEAVDLSSDRLLTMMMIQTQTQSEDLLPADLELGTYLRSTPSRLRISAPSASCTDTQLLFHF
jgi:hypothetical protein